MQAGQEEQYELIDRQVRLPELEGANYLTPVHVLLTSAPMQTGDIITIAICWMVGKKPRMIPQKNMILTPDIQLSVNKARDDPNSDQIIVFLCMAGLMTLAKEVRATGQNANYEYLAKRWQALCATIGIVDIIATKIVTSDTYAKFMQCLELWQNWIKPRGLLKRRLIGIAVEDQPDNAQIIIKGALDQVKMVLQDFGIKSILLMDAFVASRNRAMLIPSVAQQAIDLRRKLNAIREKVGDKFPYIRVYPLPEADQLNHRSYPDLYYAAVKTAINNKDLGPEGRYVVTDVQTQTSKHVVEEYASRDLKIEMTLDPITRANLLEMGIVIPQRRARDEDEDEDIIPPARRRR